MFMPTSVRSVRVSVALLAIGALAACSSPTTSPSTGGGGGSGTAIDVTLTEFEVTMSSTDVPAGDVTFNVTNDGTVTHEFVVFQTDLAEDALPEASDAPVVNEDDPQLTSMGEVEDVEPGQTKSFTATLEAGTYVGICNVETHYDSGMHIHFTAG
jgi:iron uptake system component EfeO